LRKERTSFDLIRHFDVFSLAVGAVALAALEIGIKEAPKRGWTSPIAAGLLALCLITAAIFVIRVLRSPNPLVNLGTFRDRNFSIGCLFSFVLGAGLFGSIYLMPVFLAYVRAHNALEIGEIMLVTGVAQLIAAPIAAFLVRRVDERLLTAFGFLLFAIGLGLSTVQTKATDFDEMFWPQLVRGTAIMFCILPPTQLALGHLAKSAIDDASGLFNLMRNLGGAVGLAVINQVLNERTDLHISRLHDRINWGNATAVETLNMFTQRMQGMGDSTLMAMKQLSQIVHRQAVVMGFGDVFFMMAVFYFGLSLLVMLLNKPSAMVAGGDAH